MKIICKNCKYWKKGKLNLPRDFGICNYSGDDKFYINDLLYRIEITGKNFNCNLFENK